MLQGIEYAKQQAECWKQERERNYRTADLFQEDIDAIGEPVPRGLIDLRNRAVISACNADAERRRYQHCVDVYERCKRRWDNKEPDPMEFDNDIPW